MVMMQRGADKCVYVMRSRRKVGRGNRLEERRNNTGGMHCTEEIVCSGECIHGGVQVDLFISGWQSGLVDEFDQKVCVSVGVYYW